MTGTVGAFEHTLGNVEYKGPSVEELSALVTARRGLDALLRCIAFPMRFKLLDRMRPRRLWRSKIVQGLTAGIRRKQVRRWCVAKRESLAAEDWFDLFFRQHSPVHEEMFSYFFYRFAQPRHLATLTLTGLLPSSEKPVVDLACGFGHLEHNLAETSAHHDVIGVDRNFFQLWAAQYWIAPKSRFICADADQALPFANASFSATLCSDAFHYFRRKELTINEIARCAPGRPILFTRVGNRLVEPPEGLELSPKEYIEACGGEGNWRIFGETELLERYLRQEPVDVARSRSAEALDGEKWLSLVYPGVPPVLAPAESSRWPHADGRLGFNPIYEISRSGEDSWRLKFKFPTRHYAFENAQMSSFCPAKVTISDSTYRDVERNVLSPEVERLVQQMVVVGLPHRYLRSSGTWN